MLLRSFAALLLVAAPALSEVRPVLVVDENGGGDFVLLQQAVAAAQDGDTILVRSGTYDDLVLQNLSVTVLADEGAEVFVQSVRISGLAASKRTFLSGITVSNATFGAPVWEIENCAGTVLVQDCLVNPLVFDLSASNGQLIDVTDSAAVTFSRVTVDPLTNILSEGKWHGLRATDSTVSLYDSTLRGVDGNLATGPGYGLRAEGGFVYVAGGSVRGGDGCDVGQGGAAGLFVASVSSAVTLLGVAVDGGLGSTGGDCGDGPPAPAFAGAALPNELAPSARFSDVATPIRDGGTVTATFTGEAGDFAFLLFSKGTLPTPFIPEAHGPFLPDLTTVVLVSAGPVPAGGSFSISEPVAFPFPLGAGELFTQGLFLDDNGDIVAATPQGVVYLGPGL